MIQPTNDVFDRFLRDILEQGLHPCRDLTILSL